MMRLLLRLFYFTTLFLFLFRFGLIWLGLVRCSRRCQSQIFSPSISISISISHPHPHPHPNPNPRSPFLTHTPWQRVGGEEDPDRQSLSCVATSPNPRFPKKALLLYSALLYTTLLYTTLRYSSHIAAHQAL
ncbi:hypothetical protein GGR50DRAFT_495956 [Xylaria sp. CBS 124048]|nr:hypothetical protein GGR50DRAFT_495956 [Xylaria sp. CBS 124048]